MHDGGCGNKTFEEKSRRAEGIRREWRLRVVANHSGLTARFSAMNHRITNVGAWTKNITTMEQLEPMLSDITSCHASTWSASREIDENLNEEMPTMDQCSGTSIRMTHRCQIPTVRRSQPVTRIPRLYKCEMT